MQKIQDAVNDTCFFEKRLPCHGTQQEIHPHGKNENQYDKAVLVHAHIAKESWQADRQAGGTDQLYSRESRSSDMPQCL